MSESERTANWDDLLKATRSWQLHLDVQTLLSHICRSGHELLGFDRVFLYLLDQQSPRERAHWPQDEADSSTAAAREEIARSVLQAGRSVFVRTATPAPATILCAPLTASREILGALLIQANGKDRSVDEQEQHFVDMFALQAASCLEHALLYQSAITDPLTRLFCHRHFQQEVEQAVRRAVRNERPVTLLLMDLDHFKKLNDTCGHNVGNECLLQVAAVLRSTFRCTDIVARFGGDEFEILLPDTPPADAEGVAEKVREKIGALAFPQERRVTATIGIAGYPENASDPQALFLSADAALYAAKEAGRNRVVRSRGTSRSNAPADPSRAERLAGASLQSENVERAAEPPAAVEKVDGHVVLRRLGVGSTAEVLLAIQPGLDREVALKRPLNSAPTQDQSQAFEQEAHITASLTHPGIVPIFNLGRDQDSRRYYTMKPLSGLTLSQIIDGRRKGNMDLLHAFTPGRLLEILQRVSEAIAFAHTRNVVHLDITPGNVVVGDFGEVTVIDWASSNSSSSWQNQVSADGVMLVGSPAFVAPEIVRGGPAKGNPACDVFALGTLLYYLLTDELPFRRATVEESINALLNGILVPPEVLRPEAGIDPAMSALAVQALSLDPAQRPNARAFAERLGSYVRREVEWITTQFGPGGQPILESEWEVDHGSLRVAGDHIVSRAQGDSVILWKRQVAGSFRFVCEAWTELPMTEIALVGHRPMRGSIGFSPGCGYYFQFGAEGNTVIKLARQEHDVMVKACGPLEPGRKYRIELQYQDDEGLLHCAVDGKRIFTYREMYPFPGTRLGCYSFGAGTHYRPLEISRQPWSSRVNALRAADRHYQYKQFDTALECYQEIAGHMQGRLSGMEATLKTGICLRALKRFDEARQTFHSLHGTMLEPFAIAEEGLLDLDVSGQPQPQWALDHFSALFARHPESQARTITFQAPVLLRNFPTCIMPRRENELRIQAELRDLCARTFNPSSNSQVHSHGRAIVLRTMLGEWKDALRRHMEYCEHLSKSQTAHPSVVAVSTFTALCNGRLDLLPPHAVFVNHVHGGMDWMSGLALHVAVQQNLETLPINPNSDTKPALLFDLARGNMERVRAEFRRVMAGIEGRTFVQSLINGCTAADAWDDEMWDIYTSAPHTFAPDVQMIRRLAHGYRALQHGEFDKVAEFVHNAPEFPHFETYHFTYLFKVFLVSLGYLKSPGIDDIRQFMPKYLYGPMLHLGRMFLEDCEAQPGDLWPHPLWRPEFRLLLGLWLEAKGRLEEARAIVTPAHDPRYGRTHSQPAIEALLRRTQR